MNGVMNQDTFLEYKEKLINLVNKINDGNDVLDEYYKTLNNLLSYDLGRIFQKLMLQLILIIWILMDMLILETVKLLI